MSNRVIVVGAGIAGLTAARRLEAAGVEAMIIEARERIGGRAHTSPLDGVDVDLGASWVHGTASNPLVPFLSEAGLPLRPDGIWGAGMAVFSDSGWLPPELATATALGMHGFDAEAALAALDGPDPSLADGFSWYLDHGGFDPVWKEPVSGMLESCFAALGTGGPAERISLTGHAGYQEEGGNAVVAGGYGRLVDHLAEGLNVHTRTPVTTLLHTSEGVEARWHDGNRRGDAAIVTVPLGVLQAGRIVFDPPLPASHGNAIRRLGMGTVEKLVLGFAERFWPEGMRGTARLTSDRTFPWWSDVSSHTGAPTLIGFHNPPLARPRLPRSAEERISLGLEALRSMFGEIPAPTFAHATDWGGDPHALGSYSYIPTGASPADMVTLAGPPFATLHLAGEHTVPEAYGTVHAAFLSGIRAATAVLGSL